ncbi:MAG: DUF4422 domain-containing protein [Rickettsiales bacterium]|jgi:hypothetical protein|nr:DUF4422 domain-containing protein [Rickettsiales bacterium]
MNFLKKNLSIIIISFVIIFAFFDIYRNKKSVFKFEEMKSDYYNERLKNVILLDKWRNLTDEELKNHNKNIKIFVSYHKPYTLWQHPYLIPIHLGKAVADREYNTSSSKGKNTAIQLKWLKDNIKIADNIGKNISLLNREFGEMTGVFWVWKHYEEIGNPSHVGFFQYGKLIELDVVNEATNYDMVIPKKFPTREGFDVKTTYKNSPVLQKLDYFQYIENVIKKVYPEQFEDYLEMIKQNNLYLLGNINIMKKEVFFEYCEWIFPILFELERELLKIDIEKRDLRDIAYITELLHGMFFDRKIKEGAKVKTTTTLLITPFL